MNALIGLAMWTLTLVVRGHVTCKYKSNYYTVSLTRNYERPVFCYEDNSGKKTTVSGIFHVKNLFRNQKSTLTAHTRAPPSYLARNFLPAFSSGRASIHPFDDNQSRASQVASFMPKNNSG